MLRTIAIENHIGETTELNIRDLRGSSHPEFGKDATKDLSEHINRAIIQNGLKSYDHSIYDFVNSAADHYEELSRFEHYWQLAGNAKGIIKYRIRHGKSSFHRYENYSYENLELLKREGLFKIKGRIYRTIHGRARLQLINSINDLSKGIKAPKVLEAGCGSGLNMYLLNCLNDSLELSGFEYTNARLASGIVNLWHSDMRDRLFLADVCDLKLEDNAYDIVYTNHVLEQLGQERAEKALREIWRVCKYGMVICEPSVHGANSYERWRMRTLGYCEDLLSVAESFKDGKIEKYEEDEIRYYPNTSHHLIVRKQP